MRSSVYAPASYARAWKRCEIEGVQTRIALPLFEQQLHLPAQPIGITNLLKGELRTREIGNKVARSFVLGVPGHDHACLEIYPWR